MAVDVVVVCQYENCIVRKLMKKSIDAVTVMCAISFSEKSFDGTVVFGIDIVGECHDFN